MRVTVSARVSVSVNVCPGSFKRGGVRADLRRSVDVDVARAGSRRREGRTLFGIIPLVCGFACAGQLSHTSDRCLGSAAESTLSGMGRPCRWALWLGRAADR